MGEGMGNHRYRLQIIEAFGQRHGCFVIPTSEFFDRHCRRIRFLVSELAALKTLVRIAKLGRLKIDQAWPTQAVKLRL